MWCFSVCLGKATAAARTVLPSTTTTSVCDVLELTWVRLQQPQEQRYPVIPVYVMFQCLSGKGYSSRKNSATQSYQCMWCFSVGLGKATAAARAVLPSPMHGVCDVSVFVWERLQQPQEQCYPVLPVYCGELVYTHCGEMRLLLLLFYKYYCDYYYDYYQSRNTLLQLFATSQVIKFISSGESFIPVTQ